MIIQRSGSISKESLADDSKPAPSPSNRQSQGDHPMDEPPPLYTPTPTPNPPPPSAPDTAGPTSPSTSSPPARPASPLPKPTNFLSLTKLSGAIRGRWLIDPALLIPVLLLPALNPSAGETSEQTRRNLSLKSNNGAVTAEVVLVNRSDSPPDGRTRVSLTAATYNGAVKFTLRETQPSSDPDSKLPLPPPTGRLPIKLDISTLNGAIAVSIPRSFRGIIVGTSFNGQIKLSKALQDEVQHDKEDGRSRRVFVGEFGVGDFGSGGGDEWLGDQVNAETKNGNVKIRYEDEDEYPYYNEEGSGSSSNRYGRTGLISRMWNAIF